MYIKPTVIGLATAAAFAVAWTICSLFVVFLPSPMMSMSGHMVHGDFTMMNWTMGFSGFLIGLLAWIIVSGFIAWLAAVFYNLAMSTDTARWPAQKVDGAETKQH